MIYSRISVTWPWKSSGFWVSLHGMTDMPLNHFPKCNNQHTWVEAKVSRLLFDCDMVEGSLGRGHTWPGWPWFWVSRVHQILFETSGAMGNQGLWKVSLVRWSSITAQGLVRSVHRFLLKGKRHTGLRQLPLKPEMWRNTSWGFEVTWFRLQHMNKMYESELTLVLS